MIKLLEIFNEIKSGEPTSTTVKDDDFIKMWIKENYDPKATKIYKGINVSVNKQALFVKKNSFTRKSQNTRNHYTTLFDNLHSWKSYPKRSKSLICSTSYDIIDQYGLPFLAIPKRGTKIAVCPEADIWMSFKKFLNIIGTQSEFTDFFEKPKLKISKYFVKDLSEFAEMFPKDIQNDYKAILNYNEYMKKLIIKYMTPKFNDFRLFDSYPCKLPKSVVDKYGLEVWFNADCLLISMWDDHHKKYIKK